MELNLRKPEDCTFDMISLGEIMLRLATEPQDDGESHSREPKPITIKK